MARVEAGLLAGDPTVPVTLALLAELAERLIESDLADAEHVFSLVVLADFVLENWDRAELLLDVMVRRAPTPAVCSSSQSRRDPFRASCGGAATGPRLTRTVTTEVWENPLGLPGVGAWLHAVQTRIEAGLGLVDDARAHGLGARAAATTTGTHAVVVLVERRARLPRARMAPAAASGDRTPRNGCRRGGACGVHEPGILWWSGDLIEAYWRLSAISAWPDGGWSC